MSVFVANLVVILCLLSGVARSGNFFHNSKLVLEALSAFNFFEFFVVNLVVILCLLSVLAPRLFLFIIPNRVLINCWDLNLLSVLWLILF